MRRLIVVYIILLVLCAGINQGSAVEDRKGIFAEIQTDKGDILVRLFYEKTPMTVANFLGLAEGTLKWKDPLTGEQKLAPFYNGLTFHKVIPGLMVQGGDPKGNGHGGPGHNFEHEFHPALRHDHPGTLGMLNKGSFTHGSQFFITLKAAPFLNDKHTVFGRVVEGQKVVQKLAKGDRIIRITILRQGVRAMAFKLAAYLEQARQSAEKTAAEETELARKKAQKPIGIENKKNLPKLKGNIDPQRVPVKGQSESETVAVLYLLVTYKGARSPIDSPYYDREGAARVAQQLADLARVEGADFADLTVKFSDSSKYRIPYLAKNKKMAASFEPVFCLFEGQVSDPIEGPEGFYVFRRVKLELITVRHILISYRGASGSDQHRTKQSARNLADAILKNAMAGEDFAELAQKYSDSGSAINGGLIERLVRGKTIPAFEHAAFALSVNEISDVTPTPAGYQIIKRIE
jgi:cyclophilin family peptidyl-prolyl cis-trans isomerase